jgi:hypothetical protein
VSLEPLHPANVVVRRNDEGDLEYLYYNGTASSPVMVWAESEIVHFRNYNPRNTLAWTVTDRTAPGNFAR